MRSLLFSTLLLMSMACFGQSAKIDTVGVDPQFPTVTATVTDAYGVLTLIVLHGYSVVEFHPNYVCHRTKEETRRDAEDFFKLLVRLTCDENSVPFPSSLE